jgi:stage V sporulation protein AA
MKAEQDQHIFVRLYKRVMIRPDQLVRLGHVAQVIAPEDLLVSLKSIPLHKVSELDGSHLVINIQQAILAIQRKHPDLKIEHLGDAETLAEIVEPKKKASLIAVIVVWLLLFVGSGTAIMNFHADVAMREVHQRIYYLTTGEEKERPYILQIPYSIGIGLGMVLFFNHLFKKRFNDEPSPLEVEMFLYQQNLDQYIIAKDRHEKRMKDELDP